MTFEYVRTIDANAIDVVSRQRAVADSPDNHRRDSAHRPNPHSGERSEIHRLTWSLRDARSWVFDVGAIMSNPFLTPSQGSGATPAGWYPDPEGSGRQRYWNGSTWEPVTAPSRSWLTSWPAIIVGLFLCLIPGIILLWMRPGTSPKIKAGVTVGAVLLALLFSTLGGKPANQVASPSLPPDPSLVSPTPNWVTPSAESLAPTPSETSTPSPSNGAAGASAALLLALDALPVKGRAPKTGYSRALFGAA